MWGKVHHQGILHAGACELRKADLTTNAKGSSETSPYNRAGFSFPKVSQPWTPRKSVELV